MVDGSEFGHYWLEEGRKGGRAEFLVNPWRALTEALLNS
jgi:hypothetical protein